MSSFGTLTCFKAIKIDQDQSPNLQRSGVATLIEHGFNMVIYMGKYGKIWENMGKYWIVMVNTG